MYKLKANYQFISGKLQINTNHDTIFISLNVESTLRTQQKHSNGTHGLTHWHNKNKTNKLKIKLSVIHNTRRKNSEDEHTELIEFNTFFYEEPYPERNKIMSIYKTQERKCKKVKLTHTRTHRHTIYIYYPMKEITSLLDLCGVGMCDVY